MDQLKIGSFANAHRLAGKVKRWHTAFTIQTQTVSDHVYNLMRIYVAIFGRPNTETWHAMLLHDFEELYIGDIPHWTSEMPPMQRAKDMLERMVWEIIHPEMDVPVFNFQKVMVADWIEAMEFISEENLLGNHTPMINLPGLHKRLMDHIAPMQEKADVVNYLEETGFYNDKPDLMLDAKFVLDGVTPDD
jgi:hypothetical protein